VGAPADVAEAVGRHLALSDASGFASYGLSLLPLYAGEIRAGRIAAESRGRWVHDAGSVLVIDGERGFGAPVASRALRRWRRLGKLASRSWPSATPTISAASAPLPSGPGRAAGRRAHGRAQHRAAQPARRLDAE
jgi:hypothetical protein